MKALYVLLICVVFMLGCAVPLLRKKDTPKPPSGGWNKIEDEED